MRIQLIVYGLCLPFLMFSQRAKKSVRLHAGENIKEVSHEHFRDYKLILGMLVVASEMSKKIKRKKERVGRKKNRSQSIIINNNPD